MESALLGRNHRNFVCVLLSYRTFSQAWAFHPQQLGRDAFVATWVGFFAAVNWIKLPFFLALGQVNADNLATSATLVPVAVAATWVGVLLVRRVPVERFYRIIYGLLLLVGCKLVFSALAGPWT